jgi:hypothetical protein
MPWIGAARAASNVAAAYWRDPWRSELRKVPEPAMHPQWLRRHHLLWTSPVWRAAAIEQIVDSTVHVQVAAHLAAGWPLVVCASRPPVIRIASSVFGFRRFAVAARPRQTTSGAYRSG